MEFMENNGLGKLIRPREKEPNILLKKKKKKTKKIQKCNSLKRIEQQGDKSTVKAGLINQSKSLLVMKIGKKEREAEINIKEGNFKKFKNAGDLIKDLNS